MDDWRESDMYIQGIIAMLKLLEDKEDLAYQISVLEALEEEVQDQLRQAKKAYYGIVE